VITVVVGRNTSYTNDMRSIVKELAKHDDHDCCWDWSGSLDAYGYGDRGRKAPDGYSRKAHRAAYEVTYGPIPADTPVVRHSCHNPACINPAHLMLGTLSDKMADMVSAGRHFRILTRILTDEDTAEMRRLYKGPQHWARRTGPTLGELAVMFNVSPTQVARIVKA
jgi:hypothetical protein